jgi:2-polyprenyl-3-methyl-5-hydroxy-6-metoxy-1,4-benzoquinol methylase
MHLRYRRSCRACGSTALSPVIDLGEQLIQGAFSKPGMQPPSSRRIPLRLMRCDPTKDQLACGLLQTAVTVPPEILYPTYWYRSGTNRTMREHLCGIAEETTALINRSDAWVLDIGCNDGTLLKGYPSSFTKFGVDPSNAIDAIGEDVVVVQDTFPSAELEAKAGRPFDVITSIAMFYDLEDPIAFVRAIKTSLAPDGLWVFEMSYMPSMLRATSYDTICHEHLEYYSLAVIELILARAGMQVFRATLNEINGGSIRCYATHQETFRFKNDLDMAALADLRREEFDMELDSDRPYRDFQAQVEKHRDELTKLIKELKRSGKRIHAYGASTKGNVILQFCGIDNSLIDFAADRNPDKHGARTIGSDIPIISEEASREMAPDYYLVLPWHFREEFIDRERKTMERGTRLIFPLPEIEVVGLP